MSKAISPVMAVLLSMACTETGQVRVQVPLEVVGTEAAEPLEALGGVSVTLTRADLAFGPLYLCAGTRAGERCETARLEWLGTVVVDALSGAVQPAGELVGVSGTVQSWMYDLGISAQLTQQEPVVLEAAEALGGNSLVVEGTALVSGITLPFRAEVPVQQSGDTEQGVPVVRRATTDEFFRDVTGTEQALQMRFDPATWLAGADLRPFVQFETCSPDQEGVVCDGLTEWTCVPDSAPVSRDCSARGEVCIANLGCADHAVIDDTSQAFRALRNALTSGARPEFVWLDGGE